MSQNELMLFEAIQKFMNFLVKNVFESVNSEIMIKMQIFNNLLNEKTISLAERSHLLLDYSIKLENIQPELDKFVIKDSSSSTTYFPQYDQKQLVKNSEIDNNSSSHETFTMESEKESYFSKPFSNCQETSESYIEKKKQTNYETRNPGLYKLKSSNYGSENTANSLTEFPFENLFLDISRTKEEFFKNDQYIFKEPPRINSPKNLSKSKETSANIPGQNFHLKNTFSNNMNNNHNNNNNSYNNNYNSKLMEKKENSAIEKDSDALARVQHFWRLNNSPPSIIYDRGKTPEKNIMLKNFTTPMPTNAFIKKIPIINDSKAMIDKSRHNRQFSVHNPCFSRTSYSPYHLNGQIINNVKYIKY